MSFLLAATEAVTTAGEAVTATAHEGGHHANSIVLPGDINEVIWGSIAFLIVFSLIVWKGGPAIKAMWNGRIERIKGELDSAAAAREAAEARLATVDANIADADSERSRIVNEARQASVSLEAQIVAKAESDAAEIRSRGASDVEASRSQAASDLQAEVAALALGAAERVVESSLDDATRAQLIENYISKVGAAS